MQISETLGNEIKNKFEEDWQDYIDENSIYETYQEAEVILNNFIDEL